MMRSLVRLGFHDCTSEKCDGCIDVADTKQNSGLGAMVEALTPICKKHSLGQADCFAAAGSMAVEETSYEGATLAQMPLFFGRQDAASCTGFTKQNPEATFPKGQDGTQSWPHHTGLCCTALHVCRKRCVRQCQRRCCQCNTSLCQSKGSSIHSLPLIACPRRAR